MKAEDYHQFLELAWHEEMASNSLDRWIEICNKEQWKISDKSMQDIIRIFGASWYFTRFVFVYGEKLNSLLEKSSIDEINADISKLDIDGAIECEELEDAVNHLRLKKNSIMFKILVSYLQGDTNLESIESVLTLLSEKILFALIEVVGKKTAEQDVPITILGMGRMAGYEMTFGSDLDLIYLFEKDEQMLDPTLSSIIRLLLRLVAQPSAYGQLYDVDMRLRPHGNSGPLVTTYHTFLEYHETEREVWEKQMMTRCRPVVVKGNDVESVMNTLRSSIYANYKEEYLRDSIVSMRHKVESVLGKIKSKYEIKRGSGGLMDIDFITHYFQLRYGALNPALQTTSTRQAIREIYSSGHIDITQHSALLQGYDFLKRAESALRLFDLKSVDSFPVSGSNNIPLARAMGFGNDTSAYLDKYLETTTTIRQIFCELVGDPARTSG